MHTRLVRHIYNNMMNFGFRDVAWVKDVMNDTQHISKTIIHHVAINVLHYRRVNDKLTEHGF